jgi:hypothetical protein
MNRRGFLKGMGAAAMAGAAGGANADRSWKKDEMTDQWVGSMTSETFPGALLTWKDEDKTFFLNLREPVNFSMINIKEKRLYYPKITSPNFQIKFGDAQPVNGTGQIFTFPMRQLGDYVAYGMTLASGTRFNQWRDLFVGADKVILRVQIDGQPTNIVLHDNPAAIQQRTQQRNVQSQQLEKQKSVDADNATIRQSLRQQTIDEAISQNGPIIPGIVCAILSEGTQFEFVWQDLLKYFTQFMPGIPGHYQTIKAVSDRHDKKGEIFGVSKDKWIQSMPKYYKELKDYRDKIESYTPKESVN